MADDKSWSVVHGRLLLLRGFKSFCSDCRSTFPCFAQAAVGSGAVVCAWSQPEQCLEGHLPLWCGCYPRTGALQGISVAPGLAARGAAL